MVIAETAITPVTLVLLLEPQRATVVAVPGPVLVTVAAAEAVWAVNLLIVRTGAIAVTNATGAIPWARVNNDDPGG